MDAKSSVQKKQEWSLALAILALSTKFRNIHQD